MTAHESLSGVVSALVRRQAVALLGVAALAVVLLGVEQVLREEQRHDEAVLLQFVELRGEILLAQSAHRGYVLIGDRALLAPYRRAPASVRRRAAVIEARGDALDRRYARRLAAGFEDWRRAFAEPTLRLLRQGRRGAALRLVRSGAGARRIDRLREVFAAAEARGQAEARRAVSRTRAWEAITVALIVLACLGLWLGGMRLRRRVQARVIAPASALAEVARRLGAGDLSARADVEGVHEVVVVAQAINAMADEVERLVTGLRDLHERRARFVAFTSHELRTRLTSIAWSIEALLEGEAGGLAGEQRDLLEVSRRNADRLARLVDDLLLLQRLEAGRVQLHPRPIEVAALLRDVGAELRLELEARDSVVAVDCPPELTVLADPDRLHQAVANLVVNALKFGRPGDPVRTRARLDGEAVILEVRDSGRGIPPDELAALGTAFVRASNTEEVPGTGLGLAIVREVVELHGGALEVESELGRGATFRLRLPVGTPVKPDARPWRGPLGVARS